MAGYIQDLTTRRTTAPIYFGSWAPKPRSSSSEPPPARGLLRTLEALVWTPRQSLLGRTGCLEEAVVELATS